MENIDYMSSLVLPNTKKDPWSRVHASGITILMLFLGLMTGYLAARHFNLKDELATRAREVAAGPFVQTTEAVRSGGERVIKELGEIRPYAFATLYAKVSGYLGDVLVDKGDRVKKGQLLATILSPETNSQFESATADAKNKKSIAVRMIQLHKDMAVTDEERDQAVAQSDMAAAKVKELGARQGYTTIIAPFDGIVTARFADPGALVQDAANAQSGALPVVTVSQTEKFRITVFVDQRDAAFVQVGDPAVITLAERPGVQFEARVSRKAGELDTRSRTMLTEIELANPKEEIVAGSFVDVLLKVKTPRVIQVPSQALVMRGNQGYLSVVANDGTVHFRSVQVGDNDGTFVNVMSGVEEGETIVLNMGNSLIEGQHVQIDNGAKK